MSIPVFQAAWTDYTGVVSPLAVMPGPRVRRIILDWHKEFLGDGPYQGPSCPLQHVNWLDRLNLLRTTDMIVYPPQELFATGAALAKLHKVQLAIYKEVYQVQLAIYKDMRPKHSTRSALRVLEAAIDDVGYVMPACDYIDNVMDVDATRKADNRSAAHLSYIAECAANAAYRASPAGVAFCAAVASRHAASDAAVAAARAAGHYDDEDDVSSDMSL
jgi:hypothetical protein